MARRVCSRRGARSSSASRSVCSHFGLRPVGAARARLQDPFLWRDPRGRFHALVHLMGAGEGLIGGQ